MTVFFLLVVLAIDVLIVYACVRINHGNEPYE